MEGEPPYLPWSLQNDSPGDHSRKVNMTYNFRKGRTRLLVGSTEIISGTVHMEIGILLPTPLLLCAFMDSLKREDGLCLEGPILAAHTKKDFFLRET